MIKVHSYESMGTFDGPGIRLVVFMQGCPLKCLFCANPDTISPLGGNPVEAEKIVAMAVDERPFFGKRGGVTFSGGEPTMQAEGLLPVVKALKREGIHVALDTNGAIRSPKVSELLEAVDLVLLDIKQPDERLHVDLTGVPLANTLATARELNEMGKKVWLRHVYLPGWSDRPGIMERIGELFGRYDNIERFELLPYHTLGVHKYEAMGWPYKLEGVREPSPDTLADEREKLSSWFKTVVVN